MDILLGFEVGTGLPVSIPLHHSAIFGMTQLSGKTTALEALITRSRLKAIAFITKRGEAGFSRCHTVPPYYKPRADWQFVESLVNVALGEKVKYEPGMRWAIMKVCKGHKNLRDIQKAAQEMAVESKREFMQSVFGKLVAYLEIVVPELERWVLIDRLDLTVGINVMDLSGMKLETQHLVIASTIEYIFQNLDHVVVIVPEAWETLPQSRMTPVKWVAQQFIRKGAAIGNYMFLDSIPGYEVLFIRQHGRVGAITFEELFYRADVKISITERGEEFLAFSEPIEVLAPVKNRLTWAPIKRILRHPYDGQILKLNTKGTVIDVSPNHPIMKYPQYIVEACTLNIHDRVCSRVFEKGRHHNSDVQLFIGTEDLAWLYGFYVAEGWVNGKHVSFANKDTAILEKCQRIIKENFHLAASFSTPRRGVFTLDLASPRLVTYFGELFYLQNGPKNKYTKIVPECILNAPLPIKKAFLDGYVAGDGHIDIKTTCLDCLVSASRPLVLGLTWILHSVQEQSTYSVHIRADKPKVIQLAVNQGEHNKRGRRDELKKIGTSHYAGFLYDLEVESPDHTFYAGIGNVRIHNSQDIGGIDKTPLRQCDNWLMGRMKEAHEVERVLKQLFGMKVKAEEIQTLPLGHFFAAVGNKVQKVYVLPTEVPEEVGVKVAMGILTPEAVRDEYLKKEAIEFTGAAPQKSTAPPAAELEDIWLRIDRLDKEVTALDKIERDNG